MSSAFYFLLADHKKMFATLVARNAKDIDVLIDSLPSEESCAELQVGGTIPVLTYDHFV